MNHILTRQPPKVPLETLESSELMNLVSRIATSANKPTHSVILIPTNNNNRPKKHHKHRKTKTQSPPPPPQATPITTVSNEGNGCDNTAMTTDHEDNEKELDQLMSLLNTSTLTSPSETPDVATPPPPTTPTMQGMLGIATMTASEEQTVQPFEVQLREAFWRRQAEDEEQIRQGQIPDSANYVFSVQSQVVDPAVWNAIAALGAPRQVQQITGGVESSHLRITASANAIQDIIPFRPSPMDVVAKSSEVALLHDHGAMIQRVAGKMMVVQDPHNVMKPGVQLDVHVCEPGVCRYVDLIDIVDNEVACRSVAERLRAEGIIIDDPHVDPRIEDIFMCATGGNFHDCRTHTCCDSSPFEGAYVCWKSGKTHSADMRYADPSRYTTGVKTRSGDGSEYHMSGYASNHIDDAVLSYAIGRRSMTARTARHISQTESTIATPIAKAPWVQAAIQTQKKLHRARNNMSKVMVAGADNQMEVQVHRPVHRGKLSGDTALAQVLTMCHSAPLPNSPPSPSPSQTPTPPTLEPSGTNTSISSQLDTAWEDGPSEQRRRGGCAEDKRHKRRVVAVNTNLKSRTPSLTSSSSSTSLPASPVSESAAESHHQLGQILDRQWLQDVSDVFNSSRYCEPYAELAASSDTTTLKMSKAANFAIQEVAVAAQMVKYMFVTLPSKQIKHGKYWSIRGLANQVTLDADVGGGGGGGGGTKTSTATLATGVNVTKTTHGTQILKWRDMVVRKYTSVVIKCWILISASRRVDRETNIMLSELVDYLKPPSRTLQVVVAAATPAPQPLQSSLAMMTTSTSSLVNPFSHPFRPTSAPTTTTTPPPPPPPPPLPKFAHCILGVLYLTATGYEVETNFGDLPLPTRIRELVPKLLGAEYEQPATFAHNHSILFLPLDVLASAKLIPETCLSKVHRSGIGSRSNSNVQEPTTTKDGEDDEDDEKSRRAAFLNNVKDSNNIATRIDCQSATTGRSVVQERLRTIATWSSIRLIHDILIKHIPRETAIAQFDARAKIFALTSL